MRKKKLAELKALLEQDAIRVARHEAHMVVVDKLQAIQAIDFGFKEDGKIIIVARVGGHDHVKVVDVPRNWTLPEYRHLVERLEQEYGARASFYDMPIGMPWNL